MAERGVSSNDASSGISDLDPSEAVKLSPSFLDKAIDKTRSGSEPKFLRPDSFGYDPEDPPQRFVSSFLEVMHLKKPKSPPPSSWSPSPPTSQEADKQQVDQKEQADRGKELVVADACESSSPPQGILSVYLPREDYLDSTAVEPELSILVPEFPRKSEGTATLKPKRKAGVASPRSPRQLAAEKKHLDKMKVASPRSDVFALSRPSRRDWVGSGGISCEDHRVPKGRPKTPTKEEVPFMSIRLDMDRMEFEAKDLPSSIVKKPRATSVRIDEHSAWRSPGRSPPRPGTPKPRPLSAGDMEAIRIEAQSAAPACPSYTSVVFPMPWSSSKPNFARSALDLFPACNLPPEPKMIMPVACPPTDADIKISKECTIAVPTTSRPPRKSSILSKLQVNVPNFVPAENSWNAGICDCWDYPETYWSGVMEQVV